MKYSEFIQKQVDFLKENPEAAEMNVVFANSDNRIEEMEAEKIEDLEPTMGEYCPLTSEFEDEESLKDTMSDFEVYQSLNSICIN